MSPPFLIVCIIIISRQFGFIHGLSSDKQFGLDLRKQVKGEVLPRGSKLYEKRRLVHNGLCVHVYPDWIVVPISSEDVSAIVKLANKYKVDISVRSGGHSFTCTSTKQGDKSLQ